MATTWGAINGHLRVGIDCKLASQTATQSTFKWTVYVQTVAWGFQDTLKVTLSGGVTWTKTFNVSSPNGGTVTVNVGTWTQVVNRTESKGQITLTAKISEAYNGASPQHTYWMPYQAAQQSPPSPAKYLTATRLDQTSTKLAWAEPDNSNTAGTYWYRYNLQKQSGTSDFVTITSEEDDQTSFTDQSGIVANNRYQYRVRGENDGGSSAWVTSPYVYTTPADPSNLIAKVDSSGGVNLTWKSNSPFATKWIVYDNGIEVSSPGASGPSVTLSGTGVPFPMKKKYEAFPYASSGNAYNDVVSVWRRADAHIRDLNGIVAGAVSTDGGKTYPRTFEWNGGPSDSVANSEVGPAGLARDDTLDKWVMHTSWRQYTDATSSWVTKRWSELAESSDGVTWTKTRTIPTNGASWFFGNDLTVAPGWAGGRYVASGYGQLTGTSGSSWSCLTTYSDDKGATWSPVAEVKGVPAGTSWAEPRVIRLIDGSWLMTMRRADKDEIHRATSPDGAVWTYQGLAVANATGSPGITQLRNGVIIGYAREPNYKHASGSTVMGRNMWYYSRDNGVTWTVRRDFFDTTRSSVYTAFAAVNDSQVAVTYAVENTAGDTESGAAVYHGKMMPVETGFVVPDPSGAGLTLKNIDPSKPHVLAVRALAGDSEISLGFAYFESIYLSAPPDAPTDLVPDRRSTPQETGLPTELSWHHNPKDTTAQSAFELRYRPVGSTTWTSVAKTAKVQSNYTIPGGPQPLGSEWEWQVRTWGINPDPSPWSEVVRYGVHTLPSTSITQPADEGVAFTADGRVRVNWTFSSSENTPQAGAYLGLVDLTANGALIDSFTSSEDVLTYLSPVLIDSHTYRVSVIVRDANGMMSLPAESTFQMQFEKPVKPVIDAQWIESGFAKIDVAEVAGNVDAVRLELYRSDGQGGWTLLTTSTDPAFTYHDFMAPMGGKVVYRAIAVAATGARAEADDVLNSDDEGRCGVWLSGGPGFMQVIHFEAVPKRTTRSGRDRTTHYFSGRAYPVETSHTTFSRSISVSAIFLPEKSLCRGETGRQATRRDVEALFDLPGPHLYRDSDGRVMTCYLSDVELDEMYLGEATFTVTQASPVTAEQMLSLVEYQPPRLVEIEPGTFTIIGGEVEHLAPGQWQEPVIPDGHWEALAENLT